MGEDDSWWLLREGDRDTGTGREHDGGGSLQVGQGGLSTPLAPPPFPGPQITEEAIGRPQGLERSFLYDEQIHDPCPRGRPNLWFTFCSR